MNETIRPPSPGASGERAGVRGEAFPITVCVLSHRARERALFAQLLALFGAAPR